MYIAPSKRLSASHKALLAAEGFQIPMTILSMAKTSRAALDGLRQAYDEIADVVARAAATAPGIALLDFGESPSPRKSRVELVVAKEHECTLSLTLKCPIPAEMDFWGRINLVSWIYERFDELGLAFHQRKGVILTLEGADLNQGKGHAEHEETADAA